jgi:hypothetical protein
MKTLGRCSVATLVVMMATAAGGYARDSEVRGSFEHSLKVSGRVNLEVSTGSGDIMVRTGDSSTVQIHGRIQAHNDRHGDIADIEQRVRYLEVHPPIEQDGNHITVGHLEDRELTRSLSIDYEISVPSETQLTSRTGSGDLMVEGIRGPVQAHTGSGDMKFQSINGSVEARSGSGDARFDHIAGERVEIESGSGDMELRDVRTALHVRTGSGDIRAEGEPAGDWMLHAGSGEVTLRLPSQAGFDLVAHTSSGEVRSDLPITVQGSLGHGELRGKVRGGGVRVEVSTGSGDIHIE